LLFRIPYTETDYESIFENTSKEGNGLQFISEEDKKLLHFKNYAGYFTSIINMFDDELNGLETYQYVFHTQEANETKKYNGWNFTTPKVWDSYEEGWWYSAKTTELFKTETWKIGEQQIKPIVLRVKPEMLTKVGKGSEVATSVLGVPITYNDIVERKIIWTKSTEYDENGEANIRDKRSSSTLTMPVDFDFTQREYTLKFYDFGDILAKIGGLRASIMPFFLFFAPLLVLYFLIELAKITKANTEKQATDECR